MYNVKLEQFEGPLDLLLDLIGREKLNVNEISLAQVTDQYLEYIKGMPQAEPAFLADFLVVAAQLILIKSKTLLPQLEITPEEETGIQELQLRLRALQIIKQGAAVIKQAEKKRQRSYGRDFAGGFISVFLPPKKLKPADLLNYLKEILKETVSVEKFKQETIKIIVSFEATIGRLKQKFEKVISETFSNLVGSAKSKAEVIVTFLALLELVKQKMVVVEQSDQFSDINIHKSNNNHE